MVLSTISPDLLETRNIYDAPPNWRDRYRVSYEFKTDIITSGAGIEQRRAVRANPRRFLEWTSHHTRASKLQLDWLMTRGLANEMVVPEAVKYLYMTSALGLEEIAPAVHATVLTVTFSSPVEPFPDPTSPPYWLRPGMTVLLVDKARIESRTVAGFSFDGGTRTGSIRFAERSGNVFPVGTRIHAGVYGHLQGEPRTARLTDDVLTIRSQFEVRPGSEVYADTAPPDLLGVRDLFTRRPNWKDGTEVSYVFARSDIDYDYGAVVREKLCDFPSRLISADFIGRDHEDVQGVIDFFHRQRGRRGDFFLPTWENDIPFLAITGAGYAILIDGVFFGLTYKNSTVFKRIMLRMADGRNLHFEVDFVDVLPDTNGSVLWVRDRLPVEEITPDSVRAISWVLVVRFASDRLDIDWVTDAVAQFSLSFQVLENIDL